MRSSKEILNWLITDDEEAMISYMEEHGFPADSKAPHRDRFDHFLEIPGRMLTPHGVKGIEMAMGEISADKDKVEMKSLDVMWDDDLFYFDIELQVDISANLTEQRINMWKYDSMILQVLDGGYGEITRIENECTSK